MFTTLVGTVKCTKGPLHTLHLCIGLHGYSLIVIIIEGGAYSVFKKSACLILWPDEVSTFLGEVTKVLQIQMENDFFLFLILEMVTIIYCKARQSNALLRYINLCLRSAWGILTLTCV